jgi:hypothetical protein
MASKAPGRPHRRDGRLAPQKVDRDVDLTPRRLLESLDEIAGLVHRDDGIRTTLS